LFKVAKTNLLSSVFGEAGWGTAQAIFYF